MHGQVHGALRDGAGIAEGVDHHHQVRGPGRGPLVDVQLAAPDADRPVDVPQLVAGQVGPDAGELDPLADGPAGVLADPAQQLGGHPSRSQPAGSGEHLQRVQLGPPRGLQGTRPAGDPDGARRVPAPPVRADHPLGAGPPGVQEGLRPRARGGQGGPRVGLQLDDDLVQRRRGVDGDGDRDVLALEAARSGPRDRHGQFGGSAAARHQGQGADRGGGQQDERGVAGEHRGGQREQRRGGQAPRSRRGIPAHAGLRGTGTVARTSAATSWPVTWRTHISGRRTRRWARAGTATALMSSGVTYSRPSSTA